MAIAVAGLVVVAGVVRAEPQRLRWTSYLRAGPGAELAVLDEVPVGTVVDVLACGDAWCRVRVGDAAGWLARPALAAAPGAVAAGDPVACPAFAHAGWPRDGVAERLCIYPTR